MKRAWITLCIGLAGAFTQAEAAAIFGPAGITGTVQSCGLGNPPTLSGSAGATVVNGGAGIVLYGAATSTGVGDQCMLFQWEGPMSGELGAQPGIPFAYDFTVDVPGAAVASLTSTIRATFYHEAYFVGNINQGGIGFTQQFDGPAQFHSFGPTLLDWTGPSGGAIRNFLSFSVQLQVEYFSTRETAETLTVTVPEAASIDFGYLQGGPVVGEVPEPGSCALLAAGLAGVAILRKSRKQPTRQ